MTTYTTTLQLHSRTRLELQHTIATLQRTFGQCITFTGIRRASHRGLGWCCEAQLSLAAPVLV